MEKTGKTVNRKRRNENIMGWTFISPLCIGLTAFLLFPMLFAIVVSFTDFKLLSGTDFFEFKFNFTFDNYTRAFANTEFWGSFYNVLINAIGVPVGILLAVFFTNLLIRNPKGSMFFRTLFYLPTVCGSIIITSIWKVIFTNIGRLIFLDTGKEFSFFNQENFLTSMIIMGVWSGIGTSILMLYSSMKGVDKALYESAEIDGANSLNQLLHITIPSISPVAFYILLTGISGAFQEFARFQGMSGDIRTSYRSTPVWVIYDIVVKGKEIGYGSAMALILGVILIVLSAIQFGLSKLWVHYE